MSLPFPSYQDRPRLMTALITRSQQKKDDDSGCVACLAAALCCCCLGGTPRGSFSSLLPTDGSHSGQRCAVDQRQCCVSVFASWVGGNTLFYSTAYIIQDVFLYLAYLLGKYVSSEFLDREGDDRSAVMAGLLPPMSSGRCLVSEVCQTSRERFFPQTVGQG